MNRVIVRDLYTVDTISKTNNKAWDKLNERLEETEGNILFDFKGIEVAEPWLNDKFRTLASNTRVSLMMYNSQKTINTIMVMCKLDGVSVTTIDDDKTVDRFLNTDMIAPPTVSKEEKKLIEMSAKLQEYFIEDGDTAVIEIYNKYDQIGSITTVQYIEKAIIDYCSRTKIRNVIISTQAMFIQQNILELLAGVIGRSKSRGIRVNLLSTDKDVMTKIGLYQHMGVAPNLTISDRYNIIKATVDKKTVGMLTKYKKTRGLDEFGRQGSGVPISCRVAIFEGFKKHNDLMSMVFTTFNGNTFYTKEHWSLENDGEELSGLDSSTVIVPLEDIGIMDNFIGKSYHFMRPIQYGKEDGSTILNLDESGKMIYTNVTIPTRIKTVLDDWGIKYEHSSLVHAICETDRLSDKSNK